MEMTWDYVAGFFDADGCIRIFYHYNKQKYPRLQFTNTNKQVIEEIKNFLKTGHIYTHEPNPKYKNKHSTRYDLQVDKHEAIERIIRKLIPRTIVKKQRLTDALTLIKTQKWNFSLGAYYRMKPHVKPDAKMVDRLIKEAWSLLDFCNEIINDKEQDLKLRARFATIKSKVLNDLNKILYQAGITATEDELTQLMQKAKELQASESKEPEVKENG